MPLPNLNVCFLHFSAFSDHVHISLNHIGWLNRGWCRVRGKEGQGDKQRETSTAHGKSRQTCQGKSWPQFQESELKFEPMFPFQGKVGVREQGTSLQHALPWGCNMSQLEGLGLEDWERSCIPWHGGAHLKQSCPWSPAPWAGVQAEEKILLLSLLLRDPRKDWENQIPWL